MAAIARRAAPALLATGGALSIVSLSRTTWWTSRIHTDNVDYEAKYSLWSRIVSRVVDEPVEHGGQCANSDECIVGTWCRNGERRCWTDADCQWHQHISGGSMDCARIPRTEQHSTWSELCSGSTQEMVPCGSVALIRSLVVINALLALAAFPCAFRTARLPALIGGVGAFLGVPAVIVSMTMHLFEGRANGAGFFCFLTGVALVAVGSAAAFRSRRLAAEEEAAASASALATRYGMNFKTLQEEDDAEDFGIEAGFPGAGKQAQAGQLYGKTLLQSLRVGGEPTGDKKQDLETGAGPVADGRATFDAARASPEKSAQGSDGDAL